MFTKGVVTATPYGIHLTGFLRVSPDTRNDERVIRAYQETTRLHLRRSMSRFWETLDSDYDSLRLSQFLMVQYHRGTAFKVMQLGTIFMHAL